MTKEQKLLDILVDTQRRTISLKQSSEAILLLFDISSNEAHPKENMKKVSKILGLTVASINGMLDGLELNNNIEVIPKSEVISDLKSLLMRINEARNEVNKITFNPSVSRSTPTSLKGCPFN